MVVFNLTKETIKQGDSNFSLFKFLQYWSGLINTSNNLTLQKTHSDNCTNISHLHFNFNKRYCSYKIHLGHMDVICTLFTTKHHAVFAVPWMLIHATEWLMVKGEWFKMLSTLIKTMEYAQFCHAFYYLPAIFLHTYIKNVHLRYHT